MTPPILRKRRLSAILLFICVCAVMAMFVTAYNADRRSALHKNESKSISLKDGRFIGSWRDQGGAIWEFNSGGIGRIRTFARRKRVDGFTWRNEESTNQLIVTEKGNNLLEGISSVVLGKKTFVLSIDSITDQEMRLSISGGDESNQLVLTKESEATRISSGFEDTKR